jgi:hypothetical protein
MLSEVRFMVAPLKAVHRSEHFLFCARIVAAFAVGRQIKVDF